MTTRYPLVLFPCLVGTVLHAQPTFTQSDAPVAGQTISYVFIGNGNIFAAGANQLWYLTGPTGPSSDLICLAPGDASGGSNWPSATVAIYNAGSLYTRFLQSAADGLYTIGGYDNTTSALTDYANTERLIAYPCTFGTTWTDDYATSPNLDGTPDYLSGPRTWTADGFGTLIGNNGSLNNVLKIHSAQISDTTIGGSNYHTEYVIDDFWRPGYPYFVASAGSNVHSVDGVVDFSSGYMNVVDVVSLGIVEEPTQQIGMSLSPNPAQDEVGVVYGVASDAMITVQDAVGREVLNVKKDALAPGIHKDVLDVSALPAGAYLVRIATDDGQQGLQKLVIQR